jgi:hypothetical protein
MDQKFEGEPKAEIRLEGRRVIRGDVVNDWGSRLQWEIRRDGAVVATPPARVSESLEIIDDAAGTYEVVLQMWHYVNYQKNGQGEFVTSKFVDVSNKVSFTV